MRLLADENFPRSAVLALRNAGHDVVWMQEAEPGASDPSVLARATAEGRLLLTFDKDFGELAFVRRVPAPSGIVLFRISLPSPAIVAATVVAVIASRADWSGNFAVVSDARIRLRSLG
jgi:predicted nuclease of predicted toxin-antitoxin system